MIKLAVADDHQSLVDGIQLHLQNETDIEFVGTANDGESLMRLVRQKQPNVVITDIRMPKLDGIQVTKLIKQEFPETKVLAFTMYDQEKAVKQMLQAGANGYILKNASLQYFHLRHKRYFYFEAAWLQSLNYLHVVFRCCISLQYRRC